MLKGSRRSESTMNPGVSPQTDSQRSPVSVEGDGGLEGVEHINKGRGTEEKDTLEYCYKSITAL